MFLKLLIIPLANAVEVENPMSKMIHLVEDDDEILQGIIKEKNIRQGENENRLIEEKKLHLNVTYHQGVVAHRDVVKQGIEAILQEIIRREIFHLEIVRRVTDLQEAILHVIVHQETILVEVVHRETIHLNVL